MKNAAFVFLNKQILVTNAWLVYDMYNDKHRIYKRSYIGELPSVKRYDDRPMIQAGSDLKCPDMSGIH